MQEETGFYGWRPLSGAILIFLFGSGVFFYSFGVFLSFMSTEFGWGRGVIGGALSVTLLASGLPGPLIGASINRFGPRRNIIVGNCLVGVGLVSMSFVTQIWQLYVFYGLLIGLGNGFGMYMSCATIVNNWFVKRQATAMALLLSAGGLAGFAFPPLVTWLLSSAGWQSTWLILAAGHFTATVVIGGLILVRDRPEDGRRRDAAEVAEPPVAEGPIAVAATATDAGPVSPAVGYEATASPAPAATRLRDIVRSPMFWLIAAAYMTSFFAIGTLSAHQVAYLRDLGYSPITAAFTFSIMAGSTLLGRLSFGVLSGRYDMRRLVITLYCIQLAALGILLTAPNLPLIYTYGVLFGISFGGLTVAAPTLIGISFGRDNFVRILSIAFPLAIAVEAVGPILAGAIHDVTNSYVAAFAVVAALSAAGLAYAISVRRSWTAR